jgi:hypothetical protein
VIGVSLAVGGGLVAAALVALVALVVFFGLRRPDSGSTEESAPSTPATTSRPKRVRRQLPQPPVGRPIGLINEGSKTLRPDCEHSEES